MLCCSRGVRLVAHEDRDAVSRDPVSAVAGPEREVALADAGEDHHVAGSRPLLRRVEPQIAGGRGVGEEDHLLALLGRHAPHGVVILAAHAVVRGHVLHAAAEVLLRAPAEHVVVGVPSPEEELRVVHRHGPSTVAHAIHGLVRVEHLVDRVHDALGPVAVGEDLVLALRVLEEREAAAHLHGPLPALRPDLDLDPADAGQEDAVLARHDHEPAAAGRRPLARVLPTVAVGPLAPQERVEDSAAHVLEVSPVVDLQRAADDADQTVPLAV